MKYSSIKEKKTNTFKKKPTYKPNPYNNKTWWKWEYVFDPLKREWREVVKSKNGK